MSERAEHINLVLRIGARLFQAICTCGWTSSVKDFEEVDLIRAIHAHDYATFTSGR